MQIADFLDFNECLIVTFVSEKEYIICIKMQKARLIYLYRGADIFLISYFVHLFLY